ncbi:MAG: alkaline phosphatase family protein [Alphaproteobacteria bacterium]|nr:alkaline phosphatase family protein [Alphaproteobacteria bacterium]
MTFRPADSAPDPPSLKASAGEQRPTLSAEVLTKAEPAPHSVILFVPDGLRSAIVDDHTAPALAALRREGIDFANSHSIFPTFTTANAAGFATGHYPGDTGDFSNTIYAGFPVANAGASVTPFLENDDVIREMNTHFAGSYVNETTVMAAARQAGYSTAAIGKLGPVLIQDLTAANAGSTIIIDDDTNNGGVPLPLDIGAAIKAAGLPAGPAPAGLPNVNQQKYFVDVLNTVVLPRFKQANKPFFIVFWSRDPDGTQHGQQDNEGALTPGINGPSSMAAIRNADNNLAAIRAALQAQGLAATTDLIVSADHGFATAAKQSKTSPSAKLHYDGPVEVPPGTLPPGFLAIDLAAELHLPLYDTDRLNAGAVDYAHGDFPRRGDGSLGADPKHPDIVIASNAGSDLIYLPTANGRGLLQKLVGVLVKQDYVSGLFVDDALGPVPGALPFSAIHLEGTARTPRPAVVVNFRSFDTGCGKPLICSAVVADSPRLTGHGEHGSLSRAQTFNFMAATGPDFKSGYKDEAPTSNADIGLTIARLLHLQLAPKGKQMGRVIEEALSGGPVSVKFEHMVIRSAAANGVETVLNAQKVEDNLYLDSAAFEAAR